MYTIYSWRSDTGVIAYIDNYQDYNKTGNRFSLDKFVDKETGIPFDCP